jgi:L-cystine uptake protein TcyP (sodium:dicarboxylate symporter family)
MRPKPNYQLKAMGPAEALRGFAQAIGQSWLWDQNACSGLYPAK